MTRSSVLVAVLLLALLPVSANAWDRGSVQRFATLPPGTAHPEGLTVDRHGHVWVADFDVTKASGPGDVLAFKPDGKLLRHLKPTGSSNLLLGLDFHPITGALLVIDFGNKKVIQVDASTGAASDFGTLAPADAANAGLNALVRRERQRLRLRLVPGQDLADRPRRRRHDGVGERCAADDHRRAPVRRQRPGL